MALIRLFGKFGIFFDNNPLDNSANLNRFAHAATFLTLSYNQNYFTIYFKFTP